MTVFFFVQNNLSGFGGGVLRISNSGIRGLVSGTPKTFRPLHLGHTPYPKPDRAPDSIRPLMFSYHSVTEQAPTPCCDWLWRVWFGLVWVAVWYRVQCGCLGLCPLL